MGRKISERGRGVGVGDKFFAAKKRKESEGVKGADRRAEGLRSDQGTS